jgi:hypothetical protein
METKRVYEYLVVNRFENLEPGTRLYYDYSKRGYLYHYETERTNKTIKCDYKLNTSEDYFIGADLAERSIELGLLSPGPELGEIEYTK